MSKEYREVDYLLKSSQKLKSEAFPNLFSYVIVESTTLKSVVDYLIKNFPRDTVFSYDCETTGLGYDDALVGLSLCFYVDYVTPVSFWIPIKSQSPQIHHLDGVTLEQAQDILEPFFHYFSFIGHNIRFDLNVGDKHELFLIDEVNVIGDSLILIHLWDNLLEKNLEKSFERDFGIKKTTFEEVVGKSWSKIDWLKDTSESIESIQTSKATKKNPATFNEVVIPQLITNENIGLYACEDVYSTFLLYLKYIDLVKNDKMLYNLYLTIELPLIKVVAQMKKAGVKIDIAILENLAKKGTNELSSLEHSIFDKSGCIFNIGSPKQLGEVLFTKMGYKPVGLTEKGVPSTNRATLEILAKQDKLKGITDSVATLLDRHSGLSTVMSSFLLKIPSLVCKDGFLRGNLNQCGTATGRFSSNEPNLQNMPNNEYYPVRSSFVPKKGNVFIVFDFSQFEPCVLAHGSKDKKLRQIFLEGRDIYQGIADSTGITRKAAKVVVLAVMYGMGAMSVSEKLGVSEKEGQKFLDDFMSTYTEFAKWKKDIEQKFMSTLESRTMFGRKRNLNEAGTGFSKRVRTCVNSYVQGSQADMMKLCMIVLYNTLKDRYGLTDALVLQVHDEMVLDVPERLSENILATVKEVALNFYKPYINFSVPLKIEVKTLKDWAGMKSSSNPTTSAAIAKGFATPQKVAGLQRKQL